MDKRSTWLIKNIDIDVLNPPTELVCLKATAFERTGASKVFLRSTVLSQTTSMDRTHQYNSFEVGITPQLSLVDGKIASVTMENGPDPRL